MKITVVMKDPDAAYEAIEEAVEAEVKQMGLPKDEAEALIEIRRNKHSDCLRKWLAHGEYMSVTFDTDAGTATVNTADSIR